MDIFDLFAQVKLDTSGYESALSDVKSSLSSLSGEIVSVMSSLSDAVISAGKSAVDALSSAITTTAQFGDSIDKTSQKFGMSAQAYQEWDFILQHSGASISSMMVSMRTLANAVQNPTEKSAEAFERLGISVEEAANMSQEDLFAGVISSLQNMEAGTERTAIAQALLGRSAMELGPLLNTSAEETEAMRQQVHDLGGVMSDEAVKASAAYQDSLQNLQTAFDGFKRGIGSDFLPSITKIMDGVSGIFSGDEEWEKNLSEGIQSLGENVEKVLPTVVELWDKLSTAIAPHIPEFIETILPAVSKGIADAVVSIAKLMPKLVRPLGKSVRVIATELVANKDVLIAAGRELVNTVIATVISNASKMKSVGAKLFDTLISGLKGAAAFVGENLVPVLTKIAEFLIKPEFSTVIFDAGFEIINTLINGLLSKDSLDQFIEAVPKIIKGLSQRISSFLFGSDKNTPGGLFGAVLNIAQKIRDYLSDPKSVDKLTQASKDILEGLGKFLVENVGLLLKYTQQIGQALAEGIISAFMHSIKDFFGIADEDALEYEYLHTDTNETYDQFRQRRLREMNRESSYEIEQQYPDYTPSNTYMTTDAILDYNRNLPDVARQAIRRSRGYATGGVFDRPTYALIGEDGKEAVMPLEKNTGWIDQLAARLGGGSVTIQFGDIHVNGTKDAGREVVANIDNALRQYQIMQQRGIGGTGWQ